MALFEGLKKSNLPISEHLSLDNEKRIFFGFLRRHHFLSTGFITIVAALLLSRYFFARADTSPALIEA